MNFTNSLFQTLSIRFEMGEMEEEDDNEKELMVVCFRQNSIIARDDGWRWEWWAMTDPYEGWCPKKSTVTCKNSDERREWRAASDLREERRQETPTTRGNDSLQGTVVDDEHKCGNEKNLDLIARSLGGRKKKNTWRRKKILNLIHEYFNKQMFNRILTIVYDTTSYTCTKHCA